jgi:hypothetical protein
VYRGRRFTDEEASDFVDRVFTDPEHAATLPVILVCVSRIGRRPAVSGSGFAWGVLNGVVVAKARVPALIATLGTLGTSGAPPPNLQKRAQPPWDEGAERGGGTSVPTGRARGSGPPRIPAMVGAQ